MRLGALVRRRSAPLIPDLSSWAYFLMQNSRKDLGLRREMVYRGRHESGTGEPNDSREATGVPLRGVVKI